MSKFVLHPEAGSDLNEIWEYIAADSLDAADRVVNEIYESMNSLVRFPHQGHSRADLTSRPLRFQVVRDHVIAYLPDRKTADRDRNFARSAKSACPFCDTQQARPIVTDWIHAPPKF